MKLPGISEATVVANGIRDIGPEEAKKIIDQAVAGTLIPYHNLGGSESGFYRLRLKSPKNGMKYSQKEGSGTHIYIPIGIKQGIGTLCIVEGEKKALALTEAGFPTVGISGFYGWQQEGQVHPELQDALDYLQPQQIEWVGDSDTLLNPDFYVATSRLADKLPGVRLVRLDYNGPKGADDLREALGAGFQQAWTSLPRVEACTDEVVLLDRLLELQHDQINPKDTETFQRLCKTLGRFANKPGVAMLVDKVRSLLDVKAGLLKEGIREVKRAIEHGEVVSEEAEVIVQRSYTDGTKWFVDLGSGKFTKLSTESWRNQLVYFGAPSEQVSKAQATVEQNRMVDFAGPLCGRTKGLHQEGEIQVLVTESYRMVEGFVGRSWQDTVPGQYLLNLLGESQSDYVLGWLQQARRALREPTKNIPGQALFLVGGVGLGKTLAQKIFTACLGGRAADPQNWLKGLTSFNSDLWKAEHLMISDATIQDDWKARTRLTGALKEVVANTSMPLHAKYAEALTLKPIWRQSMSANCTPNSIKALPTVDEDNADKVIMLWCDQPGWEFQKGLEIWDLIEPDLEEFCGAVDAFELPTELDDPRYGVRGFVHPKVESLVHGESSEGQLEGVLDLYFVSNEGALEGSAAYIYEVLKEYGSMRWIKTPRGLGIYLRKLSQSGAARYLVEGKRGHNNTSKWSISAKTDENNDPW